MRKVKFLPGKVRFAIFVIPFFLNSCISVQRGYIQPVPEAGRLIVNAEFPVDSSVMLIRQKQQQLFEAAELLSGHYPAGRRGQFKAPLLNRIFEHLHEQLRYDTLLFAAARSGRNPMAITGLLESANSYDRFYRQHTRVRRIVNRGNPAYAIPPRLLNKTHRFLLTPSVRKEATPLPPGDMSRHASLAALAGFALFRKGDRLNEAGYDMVNGASAVFGNSVGRFNKTHDRSREMGYLSHLVKPLDIVLMKSATHATDKFIPGFFGHAGIYLGNQAEIDSSGWSLLPEMQKFQIPVSEGHCYAEGLRSGVTLSTLMQFTDGEYFLILRVHNLSENEKRETLARILRYINQPYDFNFDVESPDRLYCSELIYLAFENVDWKSHRKWNRISISPDEIALTALENPQIEMVALILPEGVVENPTAVMVRELLAK